MHSPEELKELVEEALERSRSGPTSTASRESMRYALEMGGKRVRPVICLATGEACGAVRRARACRLRSRVELVHNFSLVHDDLPSLDDDAERRGKPSVWAAYGDGTAVLAGDGLLAEAFRLAALVSDAAGRARAGARRRSG